MGMSFGKLAVGALVLYGAGQAWTSAQMEAQEPGSSIPSRQANAEGVHAGMESAALAAQDGLAQVGPLLQSLLTQFQTGLAPLAAPQAAPTGTTLPTPVQP